MKLPWYRFGLLCALVFVFGASPAFGQVQLAPWLETFSTVLQGTPNFNAGSTVPAGWTRNPSTTGNNPPNTSYWWGGGQLATPTGNTGPDSDHTTGTGGYVYVESSGGAGGAVANLVTPPVSTVGLTQPELVFWKHQFGTTMGLLKIYLRPYGSTTWPATPIYTGTNTNLGNVWLRVAVALPTSAVNDTIELRFEMTKPTGGGGGGPGGNNQLGDLAIDDVSVAQLVTCPSPTGLVATRLSASSIQLSWTTGSATSWRVSYGTPGFNPASGTKLNATSNPFVVTGLSPSTTYEFRVKDSCSATDVSAWSTSAKAMTDCGPVPSPNRSEFRPHDGFG